jgi:fibronectin-binding autotransporter adhesin
MNVQSTKSSLRRLVGGGLVLAAVFAACLASVTLAASGTWSETTGDGLWSNSGNWAGGTIADGAGFTADFSAVNLDAAAVVVNYPGFYRNAVQVDSPRTIGHFVFGDANASSPGGWEVYIPTGTEATNIVTLSHAAPTITVNPLGPINTGDLGAGTPELIDDVLFRPNLSSTNGFTKQGAGTLTLVGNGNALAGNLNVNAGTLRLATTYGNTGTLAYNLANGTTLEANNGAVSTINVPAGATSTIRTGAGQNVFLSNVVGGGTGTGSTLDLEFSGGEARTYTADNNWAGFDAVNVTGTAETRPSFRLRVNGGGFVPASFASTRLHLDNANVFVRSAGAGNNNGNNLSIGELSGTASGALSGGNGGGGLAPRFMVGGLNTDSEFAGTIFGGGGAAGAGMSLEKVGTGTLTLSGNFDGSMISSNADPGQRGGVVRVSSGTLALAGNATSIPGGFDAFISTLQVMPGTVLDVSGTTTTFSTSPLQQVVGGGTIRGNFSHAAGTLRPADTTAVDNDTHLTNTAVATAGVMTFDAGTLAFNGGQLMYDMSLNPLSGNDQIVVTNGNVDFGTGGQVTPNFLAGTPTSGTYTVINSANGFTGSLAGWSVAWPGRGTPPTLVTNGNLLQFNAVPVVGGGVLSWRGTAGSNWDVNATANWHNAGGPAVDKFFDTDSVTFADTYAGTPVTNFAVTVATNVSPASVTVDSTNNYTIGGAGMIAGTGTFTKRGSSTLIMQKTNTFSGNATIEAGTVDVGAVTGALGVGQLHLSGGTVLGTNNGFTNSAIVVNAGTSTIKSNNATSLGLPALSGSGNLIVTSDDDSLRVDLAGAANTFSGNVTFGPDGVISMAMPVRIAGAANDLPNANVTLQNGAGMANRNGSSAVVGLEIGALSGDSTTNLTPFNGGGTSPGTNWIIGSLNANTNFAGVIQDGGGGGALGHVTKQGTGTLILSGANTYTGDTTVNGGTLSITTPFLANAADVFLAPGTTLNLNFGNLATIDTIDSLFFNGVSQQTGTWGRLGSGADFESAFFTGDGLLMVSSFIPSVLSGDFNNDGIVDAVDYTVWRNNFGDTTEADINNAGDGLNGVDAGDYTLWKASYGNTAPGSGGGGMASVVPEPASWFVALMAVTLGGCWRRRK